MNMTQIKKDMERKVFFKILSKEESLFKLIFIMLPKAMFLDIKHKFI